MNWRAMLLSGVLAAGLSVSIVPQASARHWDDRGCDQVADRIDQDRSKIAEIGPTGRHRKALQWYQDDLRSAYRDMDQCRYGTDDARYDRDPYYRSSRSYDPSYDSGRYDPSYDSGDSGSYDDPYGGAIGAAVNGDFDIKRDWPMLLGLFLNQ